MGTISASSRRFQHALLRQAAFEFSDLIAAVIGLAKGKKISYRDRGQ